MRIETPLQFLELRSKLRVCRDHFPQSADRPHNPYTCLDSDLAIQNAREHKSSVLRESPRTIPAQLLIESFCSDAVNGRQIGIEHHSLASNQMDRAFYISDLTLDGHDLIELLQTNHRQVVLNSLSAAFNFDSMSLSNSFLSRIVSSYFVFRFFSHYFI